MKLWVSMADVVSTLATATGDGRMSREDITTRSGLPSPRVYLVLAVLKRAGFVVAHRDERSFRQRYQLADKAYSLDDVVALVVGPGMGASRATKAILAAAQGDGWFLGHELATQGVAHPSRRFSRWRVRRLCGELKRLQEAGLLARRDLDSGEPGHFISSYRPLLAWSSPGLRAAATLLGTCRRTEQAGPGNSTVEVEWRDANGELVAFGYFVGLPGIVRMAAVTAGINAAYHGAVARALRHCETDGGPAELAGEASTHG